MRTHTDAGIEGFDRDSELRADIAAVCLAAGCSWTQKMAELSFVLGEVLAEQADAERRVDIATGIGAALLVVAMTGEMPRMETMQ